MSFGIIEVFFLLTAVVFTAFGYTSGKSKGLTRGAEEMLIILENNGYLKVKSRSKNEDGTERVEYSKVS